VTDGRSPLEGLDEEQLRAARALHGPVRVVAGAGTGKTTVIAHRIAHGIASRTYAAEEVLALAFSNRAAASLRARLAVLGAGGVAAQTFHAAALRQLRHFWPRVAPGSSPRLLEGKARLVAELAGELRLSTEAGIVRELAAEVEWRKSRVLSLDEYAALAAERASPLRVPAERLVAFQQAYDATTAERGQMDFEDVLLVLCGMLESEPRVAAQVRARYRRITVDEYQDISPLSQRLLEAWLGDGEEICVVGDPAQAIYGFAGGDAQYLLSFAERFARAQTFALTRSYRTPDALLGPANALARRIEGAVILRGAYPATEPAPSEPAPAARGAGAPALGEPAPRGPQPPADPSAAAPALAGSAHAPSVPARDGGSRAAARPPVLSVYEDDAAEAAAIAVGIAERLGRGVAAEAVAVLVRTNAQADPIRLALAERGISSRLLSGRPFFDLDEVRHAVMALRAASVAPSLAPVAEQAEDVLRALRWSPRPPAPGGRERERWDALEAIARLARVTPEGTDFRSFTEELLRRREEEREPPVPAVTVTTLHAAKGLEWPVVHLAGLAEGQLPNQGASSARELEEERRLLYVGLTRAAAELSLSYAQSDPRGRRRDPSRFLVECGMSSPGAARQES